MNRSTFFIPLGVALLAAVTEGASSAGTFPGQGSPFGDFTPRVPVSAFARPSAWIDPSRLHVSTSVSVGSGFGGGVGALQVTSLSYQFAAPMWMNVSVGNAWGPEQTRSGGSFFLEGLDFAY